MSSSPVAEKEMSRSHRAWWHWVCYLFSVFIVLGVGFTVYQQRISLLKQQRLLLAQHQEIGNLKQQTFEMQTYLQRTRSDLMQFGQLFSQTLANTRLTEQEEINLAETSYFIQMAYYYVEVMHQAQPAIKLLDFAQDRLAHTTGPRAFQLKQAVSNSLASLRAMTPVDVEKVLQSLEAINPLVDSLSLKRPKAEVLPKTSSISSTDTLGWQAHLFASLERLSSLVIIRYHATQVPALLAPNTQAYLLQHLHLLIQQAQWAALNRESGIYRQSLTQAKTLITEYFITQVQLTQSLVDTIDQLLAINVAPALPDLSSLVAALSAYQDQLISTPPAVTRPETKSVSPTAPVSTGVKS